MTHTDTWCVLGNVARPNYEVWTNELLAEIITLIQYHGFKLSHRNLETRGSEFVTDDGARSWHVDCFGHPLYIIMWSNVDPTELRVRGTEVIETAQPGDVVLINNKNMEHRYPPNARRDRMFVRFRPT